MSDHPPRSGDASPWALLMQPFVSRTPSGVALPAAGDGSAREAAASDEDGNLVESTSPSTHLTMLGHLNIVQSNVLLTD